MKLRPRQWRAAALLLISAGASVLAQTPKDGKDTSKPMNPEPGLVQAAGDLKFPEGPAYDGKGNVFCSNCNADYITKVTAEGQISVAYRAAAKDDPTFTFQKTNGMTFYKDGSLFVCDFGRNAIVRIHPDGRQENYADTWEGHPLEGPNDLAFDPKGNLYFTAPNGSGKDHPTGPVYRIEQGTRKVTRVAENMAFPNGLAFTADARHLYVCESQYNRIVVFDVQPDGTLGKEADGTLGKRAVFADLSSSGPGQPDGMALDSKGDLWIAHYDTSQVLVVGGMGSRQQGKVIRTIVLPHEQAGGPTNIEFAGRDLKTVYITHPGANAMFKLHVPTAGLPLFCAPPNTAKR